MADSVQGRRDASIATSCGDGKRHVEFFVFWGFRFYLRKILRHRTKIDQFGKTRKIQKSPKYFFSEWKIRFSENYPDRLDFEGVLG